MYHRKVLIKEIGSKNVKDIYAIMSIKDYYSMMQKRKSKQTVKRLKKYGNLFILH